MAWRGLTSWKREIWYISSCCADITTFRLIGHHELFYTMYIPAINDLFNLVFQGPWTPIEIPHLDLAYSWEKPYKKIKLTIIGSPIKFLQLTKATGDWREMISENSGIKYCKIIYSCFPKFKLAGDLFACVNISVKIIRFHNELLRWQLKNLPCNPNPMKIAEE